MFECRSHGEIKLHPAKLTWFANLQKGLVGQMPHEHRDFLLSFKRGAPDWTLLGVPGVESLPAVQWKLHNLNQLSAKRRTELVAALTTVLGTENE